MATLPLKFTPFWSPPTPGGKNPSLEFLNASLCPAANKLFMFGPGQFVDLSEVFCFTKNGKTVSPRFLLDPHTSALRKSMLSSSYCSLKRNIASLLVLKLEMINQWAKLMATKP